MNSAVCCQTTGWNQVSLLPSNLFPLLIYRTQKTSVNLFSHLQDDNKMNFPLLDQDRDKKIGNMKFLNTVIINKVQVHEKAWNIVVDCYTMLKLNWWRVYVLSWINWSITLKQNSISPQLLLTCIQKTKTIRVGYHSSSTKWRLNEFNQCTGFYLTQTT